MILLGIIVLVFIGPDQLPEVARGIGRFLNELKRSTDLIKGDLEASTSHIIEDVKKGREQLAALQGEIKNETKDKMADDFKNIEDKIKSPSSYREAVEAPAKDMAKAIAKTDAKQNTIHNDMHT